MAGRFRRNDAAGTGFARRHFAILRKRHARLLPRRIRRKRKIPGSRSGTSSANHFNNAASGSKICRTQKLKSKFSRAIQKKIVSPKIPNLQWLEANGQQPAQQPKVQNPKLRNPHSSCACANPEAEAVFAAREILKFVRDGNRFRDCAVLVRNLENYHKPLARNFAATESRFFSTAANPSRITRSPNSPAARFAPSCSTGNNEDLFAALKSGFCSVGRNEIDGWKTPRSNSAGAAKNGANRCRMKLRTPAQKNPAAV